ncbi:NAD(P)/FAD-dependent oxidoreductase [Nocardia asteroides]|uniref:NAD(P)/FAD-dependent oxidoreductase n=1 Tax=Nocardia asteroides TaxID=1824 RepID=UPI001E3D4ECD|nr:FAD/NAD(P)-binding oxidoreductase [Nocardia asteroides]UGT64474.1 NAD(P)/FAD-dependent oxidoreductase [Nocardia asteroides]
MTATRSERHFDVVIIGGGNAGISAAARLIRLGIEDVAVIEPNAVHTYRPLLSYVGGGQATLTQAERTQRSVTPAGASWIRDAVVAVEPSAHRVRCESGAVLGYRDLVVVPGLVPDTDALPGLDAALDAPGVTSNYLDRAARTWELVRTVEPGSRVVFTVPRAPVSCTGTTIKPLFLAAAHWRRRGILDTIDLALVVDRPDLIGVPRLDDALLFRLAALNVRVWHDTTVVALHPGDRAITVSAEGSEHRLPYDLLHLVPPFRGPRWLETSGLAAAPHGLADIDPGSLRHRTFDDIWSAGDAAAVATDPSGGALRRQIAVLADNIIAARAGEPLREYDGYTVAPIATDAHRLIAAEFDRSGAISSALPSFLDPLRPRRSAWAFDRYALPRVYWNLLLRGRL